MYRLRHKGRKPVIRAWSIGKCPTGEELRNAWANARRSQKDFIWLLSVLGELDCFTDFTLRSRTGGGNIGGRRGGLKEFIAKEAPELLPKYKTLARHMKLATDIKKAFDVFPPAQLSLFHPELPLPRRRVPFITNFMRKAYDRYLKDCKPTYRDFCRAMAVRLARGGAPRHKWGPKLPRSEWPRVEAAWMRNIVRPRALKKIKADHSLYARDYDRFTYEREWGPYANRQFPDENWSSSDYDMED
ncbi:MAG: hypothetical protein MJ240_12015 [Kiritimatiellae bacterium]|nr:hypothetical protein [Kiritimatiellia bacterium]